MEGAYVLIIIVVIHCVLFFLDVLFRSCCHLPYICLLQNLGLEVSFLRLHWHTTALNRVFQQWSNWRPQLQAIWFSVGVIVSLLLMPVAAFLVLRGLFGSVSEEFKEKPTGFKLEPVVPGINLPMSQLGNYMTALAVGGVLHELGHAMAAGREGIAILGCRAHLIIMLPVAAVEISTQRLNSLPSWRRLRILCAGVWHNVVLSIVALVLLYAISHSPLYKLDQGVVVTNVDQDSGVFGPSGLFAGDHIVSLDHCVVRDKSSWRNCLQKTAKQTAQTDNCVPVTFLSGKKQKASDVPCCGPDMSQHLCFAGVDLSGGPLRWCLRVREVVEASVPKIGSSCPENHVALTPQMDSSSPNGTRLIVIHRSNTKEPAVLFLGPPSELHQTVEISNWVPTASYLSPYGPELLYNSFSYTAALSAGLALLNLLPCYGFDGQHIFNLLAEVALGVCGVRSPTVTSTVAAGFTAVGTGCLLAWLFTAVRKLILL